MEYTLQKIADALENIEYLGKIADKLDKIDDRLGDIDKSIAYMTDAISEKGE